MPVLTNPKHERFAQEYATGKSATEAYEIAGFSPNRHNAAALARREHILTRVAEIQAEQAEMARKATEQAAERLSIDREWVLARLVENATRAAASEDYAPSNKALELIGREIAGMFVDRKNVRIEGDPRILSDEELVAILESEGGEGAFDEEDDPPLPH